MRHIPLALMLLATPAAADTFNISGQFDSFDGHINAYPGFPINMATFPLPTTVSGSLTFDAGALTAYSLFVSPQAHLDSVMPYTTTAHFTDNQNWDFALHWCCNPNFGEWVYQLDLILTDTAGLLVATLYKAAQPGVHDFDSYIGNFSGWHGTVTQTPVPMTLPLFATGLAGLGWLLRKRGNV